MTRLDDLLSRRWLRHFTAGDRVVALLGVALFVYFAATRGIFEGKASGDGRLGFDYLPMIFIDQTLDLSHLSGPEGPFALNRLGREAATGHVANPCPIGPVLLQWPTYLVGLGLRKVASLAVRIDGTAMWDYWWAALGSLLSGFAGMALCFRFLERKLGRSAARFAVVTSVAATPLTFYLVTQPLYQHACAFFVVSLLVERWDAWRGAMSPRRWLLLGAIGGLAMLMRIQEAIFLLLPGLDALDGVVRGLVGLRRPAPGQQPDAWKKALVGGLLFTAAAAVTFAPQVALWHYYFGGLHTPQAPNHMRWNDPALLATIFSLRAGLIAWSPILWLVAPGLWLARRKLGDVAWRLGLVLALEVWVNAAAWDHWGSWSYGARRFTDATIIFAAGLGGFYAWASEGDRFRRSGRRLTVATGVFFVLFNLLMMEMVRNGRTKSSGSLAFPASVWANWAGAPSWLERGLDRFGYPFIQPVGWIYALVNRAPARAFEGIVGNYMLERDFRVREVIHHPGFAFTDGQTYVVEGVMRQPTVHGWPKPATAVPTTGPTVRVLVPLMGKEPLRVKLSGDFHGLEAQVRASWNGEPVTVTSTAGVVRLEVPERLVHTRIRTNEVVFSNLPDKTMLRRLDFESFTRWWERPQL